MKGKKRIRRSKNPQSTKGLYFGPEHQEAISKFKNSTSHAEKEEIYNDKILSAFGTLVENLIYVYGFAAGADNIPELKSDCVSFLYENLHKFDETRGTKAFSYFNVIARNWLIINSRRRARFTTKHVSIDNYASLSSRDKTMISHHSIAAAPDDIFIKGRQRDDMRELLEKIADRLTESHEHACMDAIMTIFEKIDDVDLFHKRAIFVYVRDMSSLNSKQLSSAMASIRRHYRDIVKNGEGIY